MKWIAPVSRKKYGGLWDTYAHEPNLFNLILQTCTVPFLYEPGFEDFPEGKKIVQLDHDDVLRLCLQQLLDLKPELVSNPDPEKLLNLVKERPGQIKAGLLYGSHEEFCLVLKLRMFQIKKYRKSFHKQGKIVRIGTNEGITADEEKVLTESILALKRAYMRKYT